MKVSVNQNLVRISLVHHYKGSTVLNKVMISEGLSVVLMAPLWLQKEFPNLLSLLVAEYLHLPLFWNMLVQPHIQKFYQGLDIIKLDALKLSGDLSERQAFQKRLLTLENLRQTSTGPLVPWQEYQYFQGLCFSDS